MLSALTIQAQVTTDTIPSSDSTNVVLANPIFKDTIDVALSKDSLEAPLKYEASDSMIYDIAEEKIYLYGDASVEYQAFSLKAAVVVFDAKNNIVTAEGLVDSLGNSVGNPLFKDGKQNFSAQKIRYNFKTEKGIVYGVSTEEGGGFLHSEKAKFISGKGEGIDDEFLAQNGVYTTCNLDHPHYGLRSSKVKVIPDKWIIAGPSNLRIADIPTPLWLPFGFFPISKNELSGLLFPNNYQTDPTFGFGLQGIGWYMAINDYWDFQLTGDIYTRGSFRLNAASAYTRRYKHNGSISLTYNSLKYGQKKTPSFRRDNSWAFTWRHGQDSRAHPTQRFNASVTFSTRNARRLNNNDAGNVLSSSFNSNITYSKSWTGKPYRFSASLTHFQNTNTRQMTVNFPKMSFQMNKIYPFERKKKIGKDRWYEKIGFSYSGDLETRFTATDSTFFTRQTLEDASFGIRHDIPINASFRVLKYFNFTPNIRYSERWYAQHLEREFDPTVEVTRDTFYNIDSSEISEIRIDTTSYGDVIDNKVYGFNALREITVGASLATQLFGTANFRRGKLRALRHVVTPSVSFNYRPDYTKAFWGYFKEVQQDVRYPDILQQYSIYEGGVYGSATTGNSATLNFTINNTLEAKVRSRKDTTNTTRKVRLLNALSISSNYNFIADSLKLAPINLTGNTKLFNKITLRFGATFDALAANTNDNTRIDVSEWKQNRRLARFTSGNIGLSTSLRPRDIENLFGKKKAKGAKGTANKATTKGRKTFIESLNLNYNFVVNKRYYEGVDSIAITTNSISLRSKINISNRWDINIGNIGYDFTSKRITYPDLGLSRDLHCWTMGFSWQPVRGTYAFYVRVKQPPLDFINIPYGKGNAGSFGSF